MKMTLLEIGAQRIRTISQCSSKGRAKSKLFDVTVECKMMALSQRVETSVFSLMMTEEANMAVRSKGIRQNAN